MVQLLHLYMTSGKTIALNIQNFVGKVMSLLFNILSRFLIAFLPRGYQESSPAPQFGSMEYYSIIKKNEILPPTVTWTSLKGIMLSETIQAGKTKHV